MNTSSANTITTFLFDCKLVDYAVLYSNKIMWGSDCDIDALLLEIRKLYLYKRVQETFDTENDCNDEKPVNTCISKIRIPVKLRQKIQQYHNALQRSNRASKFCRHC